MKFSHIIFLTISLLTSVSELFGNASQPAPDSPEVVLELFFIAKDEVDPFTEGEYIRLTYRNSSGRKVRVRGTLQEVRGDSFQIDETWISVASVHRISSPSKRFRKHPEISNKKLVMFPLFVVPICLLIGVLMFTIGVMCSFPFDNEFCPDTKEKWLAYLYGLIIFFLIVWAGPIAASTFTGVKLRVVKERQLRTSSRHEGQEP